MLHLLKSWLFLAPVALLTLLMLASWRWLQRAQRSSEAGKGLVTRSLAAVCGLLCFGIGVTSLVLIGESLPHLSGDDLLAALIALAFILPAGVVLLAHAFGWRAPQVLTRWVGRVLEVPPDNS